MQIESERVSIHVGGHTMGGYLARPVPQEQSGEPRRFPAVLVFMEIFGINPHIRSVVDRIAAEGYVALAPDYYHRIAPGFESAYDQPGMEKGMALIPKLKAAELIADAHASISFLHQRADVRGERIGAIGFCIGGHIAYLVASTGALTATASFYGGGIASHGLGEAAPTVSRTAGIKGKIICFFGGQDASIPDAQVETIRKALYDHGVRHEVFTYPNAGHGFFRDASGAFHQMSRDDAWKKVKKLFLDELHGPG
jgi:carboxymethylenebutenolidase